MASRLSGQTDFEALVSANEVVGLSPREWLRIGIEGGAMLSLPVTGGASALKNHPSDTWRIAAEGPREIRKMKSTIATIYGRTPYYRFVHDLLLPETVSPGEPAREVCTQAFHRVCDILHCGDEALLFQIKERMREEDHTLREVCSDIQRRFNDSLSILDALMKLGPDAIFALLPSF